MSVVYFEELCHKKDRRDFMCLVDLILKNKAGDEEFDDLRLEYIRKGFKRCGDKQFLYDIIFFIKNRTELLEELHYTKGIIALVNFRKSWIRRLEDWNPDSSEPEQQFYSLTRHLLTNYHVPHFMDNAWFMHSWTHQLWFIELGNGKSVRNFSYLPIKLSKKAAYFFLSAPKHYSVIAALRWGQVHTLGGDKKLADALSDSLLAYGINHDDFWQTVIQFLIRHPEIEPKNISSIIDYINRAKFPSIVEKDMDGLPVTVGYKTTDFSIKGFTPKSLMRRVEDWQDRELLELMQEDEWNFSKM